MFKLNKPTSLILATITSSMLLTGCGSEPSGLALGEERVDPHEAREAIEMAELIRKVSFDRARERKPIKRFNQVKTNGCVEGEFKVKSGLPNDLAQGIFKRSKSFKATMRFANASEMDDTAADFRGLAIKVHVDDNEPGAQNEQDFLFNSQPALFAADPKVFHEFIKATDSGNLASFAMGNIGAAWSLLMGRDNPDSMFEVDFFSTTPSRLGHATKTAVKYSVQACEKAPDYPLDRDDANYLRQSMIEHLRVKDACFNFMVQKQTNPDTMPIEDASVEWPTSESPFVTVATITVKAQNFIAHDKMAACEAMTFSPWNGFVDHQPLGGINRVRKAIYEQLGDFRNDLNNELSEGAE